VSRLSDYLKITNVDSRLLFARGAVLVFVSQIIYVIALTLIALLERWLRLAHPALGSASGAGRIVWMVVMFALTLTGMIAQLYGIKLLSPSVRPWSSHSIPAILCLIFAIISFVLLVGVLTLLVHRIG
jgi:uncharacterized membrane protein YkvI